MQIKYSAITLVFLVSIFLFFSVSAAIAQNTHSQHESHSGETQDTESFQAIMSIPDEVKQGQPFSITISIKDNKGKNVSDFNTLHEKLMHLIMVSDDLGFFSHVHPEYKGNGVFVADTILDSIGGYTLFCDYKPAGQKEQVSVLKLGIKGTSGSSEIPDVKKTDNIIEDIKVSLKLSPAKVRIKEEIKVAFDLKKAEGNKPLEKGLLRYLGEKGHLVIIRKSSALTIKDYIHTHAIKVNEYSRIEFLTDFSESGLYKIWCQFNYEGKVLTVDFWINVEP